MIKIHAKMRSPFFEISRDSSEFTVSCNLALMAKLIILGCRIFAFAHYISRIFGKFYSLQKLLLFADTWINYLIIEIKILFLERK